LPTGAAAKGIPLYVETACSVTPSMRPLPIETVLVSERAATVASARTMVVTMVIVLLTDFILSS
jgi:hypothetical protein